MPGLWTQLRDFLTRPWITDDPYPAYSVLDRADGLGPAPQNQEATPGDQHPDPNLTSDEQ